MDNQQCKSCGDIINPADIGEVHHQVCIPCWDDFADTASDPMYTTPAWDAYTIGDDDIPF
jgi:hypothetical protein|tara:strand:+ start:1021 stop:1200 length:180 start_codon:yes stop_codon:yes gene_type:complete